MASSVDIRGPEFSFLLAIQQFEGDLTQVRLLCTPQMLECVITLATELGHVTVIRCLVENFGFNVDRVMGDDSTPLCIAAKSGHEDAIRWLIKAGSVINPVNRSRTPLGVAIQFNCERIVRCLTEELDARCPSPQLSTPLSSTNYFIWLSTSTAGVLVSTPLFTHPLFASRFRLWHDCQHSRFRTWHACRYSLTILILRTKCGTLL